MRFRQLAIKSRLMRMAVCHAPNVARSRQVGVKRARATTFLLLQFARCDQGRVVCPKCVAAKRLYAEHQSTVPPNVMEIGGFQTDKGYVRLTPPLRLDVKEIPVVDGSFDWDYLSWLGIFTLCRCSA